MTPAVTLCLVLAAVYGLSSLLLTVMIAVTSTGVVKRVQMSANELLVLRLLPFAGGSLLALTVALPAFVSSEPAQEFEDAGPLLLALAALALAVVGAGACRAWRASVATARLLKSFGPMVESLIVAGQRVTIVDSQPPLVAVVGGWRPRIVASRNILDACTQEEFSQVIAHERAHLDTRDNLKLLLLLSSPDPLAWHPCRIALVQLWRQTAEREADERAAGEDRHKRLALASALIKVARLSAATVASVPTLSMSVAQDDVESRVRSLLATSTPVRYRNRILVMATCGVLVPVFALPLYGTIHRVIEILVAYGR